MKNLSFQLSQRKKVCSNTQGSKNLLEGGCNNALVENDLMKPTVWEGFTEKNEMEGPQEVMQSSMPQTC